jgi:hypothetical protein
MSKRKFDQFSDLCHLFPTTSNIVVSNFIQVPFLILTVEWLALAMDNGILGHNSVVWRIKLDNFEFHLSHTTAHCEQIAHPYWAVGLKEVRLEVNIEERTSEALNGICNWKNSDSFGLGKGSVTC